MYLTHGKMYDAHDFVAALSQGDAISYLKKLGSLNQDHAKNALVQVTQSNMEKENELLLKSLRFMEDTFLLYVREPLLISYLSIFSEDYLRKLHTQIHD